MRINEYYAYICAMKTRLNITIEQTLLEKVKVYALRKQISISSLIEDYLETVVRTKSKRRNIIDMVDKLHPDPHMVLQSNDKDSFYEDQKQKYGF